MSMNYNANYEIPTQFQNIPAISLQRLYVMPDRKFARLYVMPDRKL